MTRTPMARLPWLIQIRFSPSSDSWKKKYIYIFRDILGIFSYFIMKVYVVVTHKTRLDTQHTIIS